MKNLQVRQAEWFSHGHKGSTLNNALYEWLSDGCTLCAGLHLAPHLVPTIALLGGGDGIATLNEVTQQASDGDSLAPKPMFLTM